VYLKKSEWITVSLTVSLNGEVGESKSDANTHHSPPASASAVAIHACAGAPQPTRCAAPGRHPGLRLAQLAPQPRCSSDG
jgi:hypothetical protein